MRTLINTVATVCVVAILVSCGTGFDEKAPYESRTEATVNIIMPEELSLKPYDTTPYGTQLNAITVTSITITVSASDMTTIVEYLSISQSPITASLQVPSGFSRTFTVTVDTDVGQTYQGSQTVDLSAGGNISLTIAVTVPNNIYNILTSNTAAIQDYDGTGTALAAQTAAGTVSSSSMLLNLPSLNTNNLNKLSSGTGGVSPTISFNLSQLAFGSGTSVISIMVKDGTTSTKQVGQKQIAVSFTVNYTNDGTTLSVTPASGSATITYYTSNSSAEVIATVANSDVDMLGVTGSGTSSKLVLSPGTLFNAQVFSATPLQGTLVTAGDSFYYRIDFNSFSLKDASGSVFTQIYGTFDTQ